MKKKMLNTILIGFLCWALYQISIEAIYHLRNPYTPSFVYQEDKEPVAEMSIYARAFGPPVIWRFLGHSWIYIYNISDSPIYISDVTVNSEEGVTLGTTAMPTLEHRGIWYNLESHNLTDYGQNVGYKAYIYDDDIEYINNFINNHNRWSIAFNCSTFSASIWNNTSAGIKNKFMAATPKILENSIKSVDGFITNGTFKTEHFIVY